MYRLIKMYIYTQELFFIIFEELNDSWCHPSSSHSFSLVVNNIFRTGYRSLCLDFFLETIIGKEKRNLRLIHHASLCNVYIYNI